MNKLYINEEHYSLKEFEVVIEGSHNNNSSITTVNFAKVLIKKTGQYQIKKVTVFFYT